MGLRPREDCDALWRGLADGRLSTLATDEYTTSYAVKMAGTDIESTPGGHVGIETRGMIGFSEGVGKRGFSLRRFVEIFATNPARVTGLYPRKGVIAPGSDADLVLWDPAVERTITIDDLHHDGDYSPWEGWQREGLAGDHDPPRQRRRRGRQAQRGAWFRAVRSTQARPRRTRSSAVMTRPRTLSTSRSRC